MMELLLCERMRRMLYRANGQKRKSRVSLSVDFLRFFWNHSLFLHRSTCKSRVKVQIGSAFVNVQHVWKIEKKQPNKKKKRRKKKQEKRKESLHNVFRIRSDRTQGFPWFWKNNKSVLAKANLSSSFGVSVDYSTTKRFCGRFFLGPCKKETI